MVPNELVEIRETGFASRMSEFENILGVFVRLEKRGGP
jgi:hypothetical protein